MATEGLLCPSCKSALKPIPVTEGKRMTEVPITRKFEVYDIDWIIDDVSLATCGDNWSIQSPEFTVIGFHATKWLIVLTPTSNENQPDSVVFTLKRCSSDGGPESVYVQWRLEISVSGCDKAIAVERICDFVVGTEHKEILKGLKNSIEMIKPFESDLVSIRCRMIIYDRASNETFGPCKNEGIRYLSYDLLNLFESRNGCDLTLKIGHKIILAHKAIVCARIPKLSQLLGDADTCNEMDTIDLPNLHYEAMMKIMEYVYSGDSSHVLSEPSLGICDSVEILDIRYLKEYYYKKKLSFRTSMNAQETTYKWSIREYLKNFEDVLVSPAFSGDCSTTWRLKFFYTKENLFKYFSIFAENVGEVELGNMCVEFAITNECGGTVFAKWLRRAASDPEPLGFDKFICRSMVKNFLTKGTLHLTMKLKLPSCEMRSYREKYDVARLSCSKKIDTFNILYHDMKNLFNYSVYPDLILQLNGMIFRGIHKSIVTARCSNFFSLFRKKITETNCISFPDIESEVLNMLLYYLYCGRILKGESREALLPELRKAAQAYNLPLLADMCEERMNTDTDTDTDSDSET